MSNLYLNTNPNLLNESDGTKKRLCWTCENDLELVASPPSTLRITECAVQLTAPFVEHFGGTILHNRRRPSVHTAKTTTMLLKI
uniref:Uncharacterized protein n=1 Tax=Glossina brevipalpis TaxID=37001 RepID=A0A1A9WQ95_9MUSC